MTIAVLMATLAGCTSTSNTEAGVPCTGGPIGGCFYYVQGGVVIRCEYTATNICQNTTGEYYMYADRQTYLCTKHDDCSHGQKVDPPAACAANASYDKPADRGQAWKVANEQQSENTTRSQVTVTFTSTSTSTATVTASVEITADADAILGVVYASVHAKINASTTKNTTAVVGNAVNLPVPAGKTAHGVYGVKMQVSEGNLTSNNPCAEGKKDFGRVTTYVPISPGWCVWLSDQPPCVKLPA